MWCRPLLWQLGRAKHRNVYDELIDDDLNAYLNKVTEPFDLITSADTLCYFGSLDDFLQLSQASLSTGGRLIFTVEKLDGESDAGFHLETHGRYSHTREYQLKSITVSGLVLEAIAEENLRRERGDGVKGFILTLKNH